MKVMDRILSWATLLCFVGGAVLGLIRPDLGDRLAFLGSAYVTALKYLALSVLILSVFHAALRGGRSAAGILLKTVALFVLLFSATFLLSAVPYTVFSPGKGFALVQEDAWVGEGTAVTVSSILKNTFSPGRMTGVTSLYFPAIVTAFLLGWLFGALKLDFLEKGAAAVERFFLKLLSYVMLLTPLGVFSLMARAAASFGLDALRSSGVYIAWAYGGCLLALLVVMLLPLRLLCGITPGQYFKRIGRLLLTALSTCSSAATLPETMRTCREEFGVSERTVGIVAPLGCTIHMCGGAVSFCLLGSFVLQMTGRSLSPGMLLLMLLCSLLLNMAAPGIPGGGIVLGATYLGMLGVEHAELFLGMYAGIYRVLDMAYTSLNVLGDVSANILIDRGENKR